MVKPQTQMVTSGEYFGNYGLQFVSESGRLYIIGSANLTLTILTTFLLLTVILTISDPNYY